MICGSARACAGNRPAFERAGCSGSRVLGRWLLTAAVLAWFAVLILVPDAGPGPAGLPRRPAGRSWTALGRPEVQRAFGMTLGITALATVVNTVFGIGLALWCWSGSGSGAGPWSTAWSTCRSPSRRSSPGLMLIVLYGPDGWLGRWLEPHGIRVVYAVPGMILATMFVTVPFVVRELVPVLRELGDEHEQAAYTLGAGRWRTFWSVTLPSIRWGVAYGVTLTVARSLGEFGAVLVVSGNVIGQTQTATLYIHDGIESFHPEGAYAASLVLAAVSFVLLIGMDAIRKRLDGRKGESAMSTVANRSRSKASRNRAPRPHVSLGTAAASSHVPGSRARSQPWASRYRISRSGMAPSRR